MYAGEIVEEGPVSRLLASPAHPYTRALLAARPPDGSGAERRSLPATEGPAAVPGAWPPGCRFAPRCPVAYGLCGREKPRLTPLAGGRAACHLTGRGGT